ncbi:MAG: enoyl-CoA hydratase [Desulfobacterales bacterium]|jgi:enoyl-CoA hydratase/carnithine racemase
MPYQEIKCDTEGPIGYLTLNNPERINALSTTMVAELTEAIQAIGADSKIKVVILRAEGKHFCAGHDLSEMLGGDMAGYRSIFERCGRMMLSLRRMPQPVIAQVQGIATAAGCQLVAWADLAVAEKGARFATPGVKIGLFCSTPMVALTRAIGRKAAMEMLLTGRYVSAEEARVLGLVNRVVEVSRLAAETEEMALQIAEASALAIGIGKQAFYEQVDMGDEKALAYGARTIALNCLAEDARIGIHAFLEKTTPEWKDR